MGAERRSMIISDKEKRTTAVHEAGHALVAKVLPNADPVHKVTIIPRGRALGVTQQLPEEDRLNINQEFALNQNRHPHGRPGRRGDHLRPEDHRRRQRHRAGHRHGARDGLRVGHERALGPLAFGKKEGEVFLGRDMASTQTYSEQTAREIDAEVRRIVNEQYERAKKILLERREALDKIADALLEYETLDLADVDVLLAGGTINRPPPPKSPPPSRRHRREGEGEEGRPPRGPGRAAQGRAGEGVGHGGGRPGHARRSASGGAISRPPACSWSGS